MPMAAPPEAGSGAHPSFVAGCLGGGSLRPIKRLARLMSESSEDEQARQLEEELGVTDTSFLAALRRSCQVCRRGVLLYPGQGELAVSFNGGKDACVVLYLWLAAVLAVKGALGDDDALDSLGSRTAIYFDSSEEFPEVRDFVSWTVKELGLSMATVEEKDFRQGMGEMVDGGLRAVVMGQRSSDPYMKGVDAYSPSSDGWPPFMRINPILDWSYRDIWTFLRAFSLPYCRLYDEGYTSLGSIPTTFQNPALQRPDGSYMPAWQLDDGTMERAGRVSRHRGSSTAAPPSTERRPPQQQVLAAEKAAACEDEAPLSIHSGSAAREQQGGSLA